MQLLIDIGNTRIKWAIDEAGEFVAAGSLVHRGLDPDEAAAFIRELSFDIRSAGVVNVAGNSIADAVTHSVRERFGVDACFVSTTARCGEVKNGYKVIEQLGTDRWAAIVGAWEEFRTDLCVVDAGTAVTIDMVSADGSHAGGMILPGLQLMAASLNRDTSDIEGFADSPGDVDGADWYGRDTRTAVQRGALFALQSAINESACRYFSDSADTPRVVVTGGDAAKLLPFQSCVSEHRPDLVLQGLRYLLEAGANA